jgi:hypothetical protein
MGIIRLGQIYGLTITAGVWALAGLLGVWALVTLGALALLDIPTGEAILGGFIASLLHIFNEVWHQIGHAWAARRTGYPMTGVHLWTGLGTSIYPPDEGDLPPDVHVRRALGGPMASLLLSGVAAGIALALRPWDATPGWIAAFFFLDNLLVFTLGAFAPLGFTDGSTLLKWYPRARAAKR